MTSDKNISAKMKIDTVSSVSNVIEGVAEMEKQDINNSGKVENIFQVFQDFPTHEHCEEEAKKFFADTVRKVEVWRGVKLSSDEKQKIWEFFTDTAKYHFDLKIIRREQAAELIQKNDFEHKEEVSACVNILEDKCGYVFARAALDGTRNFFLEMPKLDLQGFYPIQLPNF